jgi:hypothetical protein
MNGDPLSYRLELIAGGSSPLRRNQILDLWIGEGVLSTEEASRRVSEVIYAIVDAEDAIHGVTTAYTGHLADNSTPVWFLRMFIRRSARKASGLKNRSAFQWETLDKTCQFLRQSTHATHRGIVMVTENRKLWSEHWRQRLGERGWQVLGTDPRGNLLFFLGFNG